MRIATLLTTILLTFWSVSAYDFYCRNSAGTVLYFNYINEDEVELTYQNKFEQTYSYSGDIVIPETVKQNGVTLTVTGLSDRAFHSCRQLTSVQLPSTLKKIGQWAFAWCDGISRLSIPESVVLLGANAFDGCYGLTEINVDNANEAFSSVDGAVYTADLKTLVAVAPATEGKFTLLPATEVINERALGGCTFVDEIDIPEGVRTIGANAFYFCNWLKRADIPASVSEIGDGSFGDCFSLEAINVSSENEHFSSTDGVLYDKDKTLLIQSPGATAGFVDIPETVTTIAPQAFFRNCALTTIKLPENITNISEAAFVDCPNISSAEIPASVTTIGDMAFGLCTGLEAIYIDVTRPSELKLGEEVFAEVNTDKCALYVPTGAKPLYSSAPQWKAFKNIYENSHLSEQTIEWEWQNDTVPDASGCLRLSAKASSQLDVKYRIAPQSQGFGIITENRLQITEPGIIIVTAYQPGNNAYRPAKPVSHRFFDPSLGAPETTVAQDNIRVYGAQGQIIIMGAETSDEVQVYLTDGRLFYSGINHTIEAVAGTVYLVRIKGHTFKVAVR